NSLSVLIEEYRHIIEHIGNKSYEEVISVITTINKLTPLEIALEEIESILRDEVVETRDTPVVPVRVKQGTLRSQRFQRITQEVIYTKTDYLKKAKEQHVTGLKGEQIALEIEKNRILRLGYEPDQYVKWVA